MKHLGGVCPSFTDEILNVLFDHVESRQNIQKNDMKTPKECNIFMYAWSKKDKLWLSFFVIF